MTMNDLPPVEKTPPADAVEEPDERTYLGWQDLAIMLGLFLVLAAVALALWIAAQHGGGNCAPVHQALGHC